MFKEGDYWVHHYSAKKGRIMKHIKKATKEEAEMLNRVEDK